jgi:hypothetical protein
MYPNVASVRVILRHRTNVPNDASTGRRFAGAAASAAERFLFFFPFFGGIVNL